MFITKSTFENIWCILLLLLYLLSLYLLSLYLPSVSYWPISSQSFGFNSVLFPSYYKLLCSCIILQSWATKREWLEIITLILKYSWRFRESATVSELQVPNTFCILNPRFRVLLMGSVCFPFLSFNLLTQMDPVSFKWMMCGPQEIES